MILEVLFLLHSLINNTPQHEKEPNDKTDQQIRRGALQWSLKMSNELRKSTYKKQKETKIILSTLLITMIKLKPWILGRTTSHIWQHILPSVSSFLNHKQIPRKTCPKSIIPTTSYNGSYFTNSFVLLL